MHCTFRPDALRCKKHRPKCATCGTEAMHCRVLPISGEHRSFAITCSKCGRAFAVLKGTVAESEEG